MHRVSDWLQGFKDETAANPSLVDSTLQEQKEKKAITISITGGKGGVGKTSVALKLAKELAESGKKVLLIDCDYNLSNTAIKLGIPLRDDFFALLSSAKDFKDCLYKDGNFHLLCACNGNLDLFDGQLDIENYIIDILNSHQKDYDYIFLDCPAGIQRNVITLNAYCQHRVVVVTPDKSSITDSYSLIKVLKNKYGITENHLVVNKIDNKKQFARVVNTLSETIENFLGCRTSVLGGIKIVDNRAHDFDTKLFKRENSDIHKNFMKVLGNLTDKLVKRHDDYSSIKQVRNYEQEVQ